MSLASWICIGLIVLNLLVIYMGSWYADKYRDERQENERLRSLLETLGCSEYPVMRLVPLDARERLRGHKCGNAKTD